ncbi:intracellular motility protein A [Corynebacterium diphtheriae]|uniref:intracellular motility protein A n=1 Tax=Corynebacterium diphtheriae TaxID=1717 RepID=UPI0013C60CE4|nr:intracellular motility protein A [Corynebacterium diphtheriae]MBG9373888.1 intracellular motility protein A [Corynebacterium diphtheriae bv. gravis]CAB0903709.1 intracellular motility protein A [Corynebacterium diphtheriae]
MKRNKRVIASAALSVSLATSGVAPVAWADEMHVKCPQKFHGGSDFDGDVNAKVEEHLQRNCELTTDQISRHSIRDEKFGENTGAGTGGEQQSEPLRVNEVKAGDREITGLAFLLPGQKKTVQVTFLKNFLTQTVDLKLNQSSTESGDTPRGEYVPFKIAVPEKVELKEGDRLLFSLKDNPPLPGAGKTKNIEVYVKPADKGAESQPEQTPDGGNDRAPGPGAGDGQRKPEGPGAGDGQRKPEGPSADDNPGTGKGSLSFGSIFGVIAGLGGVVALVMSVVKFFNQNSDVARFLQPLRNFFSLFKF